MHPLVHGSMIALCQFHLAALGHPPCRDAQVPPEAGCYFIATPSCRIFGVTNISSSTLSSVLEVFLNKAPIHGSSLRKGTPSTWRFRTVSYTPPNTTVSPLLTSTWVLTSFLSMLGMPLPANETSQILLSPNRHPAPWCVRLPRCHPAPQTCKRAQGC